jgi:hypothetical protein
MSSFKGFRSGSKLPKADVQRRVDAYNRKLEEYDKLSLDELKELYPTLKGSYKMACEMVTMQKMNAARELIADKANDESSKEDMVTTAGGAIEGE